MQKPLNSQSPDNVEVIRLVSLARTGDQQAFSDLYEIHFERIYRFAYFRVGHKETAEDICEEVFVKAYGSIKGLKSDSAFIGWLFRICQNLVIDYYRKKKEQIGLEDLEHTLAYESNLLEAAHLQMEQKRLLVAIKKLPVDHQRILYLKFFEQLNNDEIAAILNKKEPAIRVAQHRAINKLKEVFQQ